MSDTEQQTKAQQPQQKRFERKPNREVFLSTSKDGRFFIVKVVESWILPRNYPQKVLSIPSGEATPAEPRESSGKPKKKRS